MPIVKLLCGLDRRLFLFMLFILTLVFLPGCAGVEKEGNPLVPTESSLYRDSRRSPSERAADLLGYMNLDEKIGQMIQIDRQFLKSDEHITTYGLGSLLSGGGSVPKDNSPEGWADMIDSYQRRALETRLAIPLLYGIDAVHGNNNLRGATIFPHNIGLGAGNNPKLVEEIGKATALESVAIGVNWNFSPSVAIPKDIRWGRTYEGFSEDPQIVAALGTALVRGMQGAGGLSQPDQGLSLSSTLMATLKHFIGDGGTLGGRDQGDVPLPIEQVMELFVLPYEKGIAAGAGSVMATYNSIRGTKVHGSRRLLTTELRTNLGFEGLLVSDWAAIKQLPGSPTQQLIQGVNAGIDMLMVPDDYHDTSIRLRAAVLDNAISMERIDQAVFRILEAKFALGLFENPFAHRQYFDRIGSQDHRSLARQAVRESVVMLKNENQILPLVDSDLTILLAGSRAHDIGSQSGGWTLTWQGFEGNLIPGTTIKDALIHRSSQTGLRIIYSPDGTFHDPGIDPDLILVVVGEEPYAEMMGDSEDLTLPVNDREVFQRASSLNAPVITIVFSGRPVIIPEILENSAGVLAAWLPGSEGAGVIDVLFGDVPVTGTLPFTWPKGVQYLPLQFGVDDDPATQPPGVLFPRGFGLTYTEERD